MSLRVWLPLTKDLRQQGLDNVTVTNNGATFNSVGKLGGCYEFASGKRIQTTLPASTSLDTKAISFACWMYITSWNSSYDCFMSIADGTSWVQSRATLCRNNTASTLTWNIADGTNRAYVTTTTALSLNTWTHVVGTYDGANLKIYINGVLNNTSATTLSIGYAGTFNIGGWSGNNYPFNGRLNDVRIYNHCLSPMEVKELAQGLVLHYPLDRQGWGQENLLLNSSIEKSGKNTIITYDLSTEGITAVKGATMRISADIKSDVANATIDCYVRSSISSSMCSNTIFTGIGTTYQRYTMTTVCNTNQDKTPKWFAFRCNGSNGTTTTATFTIKNVKLELGEITTPWCPNSSDILATTMGLNGTIEYDCSGFCNNGSKMTETITYTSDTAKYAVSTHFNGTYDGILIENLQLSDIINTAVTYAFWIKPESESGARSVYFGSYSGTSWSIEKTTGNILRLYWNGSPDETCSGATITDGVWQHICVTKNGTSDVKVYINGVQKWTSTSTHSNLSFPTTYRIGRDSRSNDGTPYKGLMSDFRIYATALSADDVKSLYQNCATIDPDGTIRGQIRS